MKFHKLNVKAKNLLNTKQNVEITSRRIYLLIKQHNDLCLMLERFNHFWKHLLVPVVVFYIIFLWFSIYIPVVYSNLTLLIKLFMYLLLFEGTQILACFIIIIITVSLKVINYFNLINSKLTIL